METPDTSISEADQIDRVAFIGERAIGAGHPPYVIAELGVNHDGDPAKALELVRIAADAGADAIKLQLFEAERLMSADARLAAYQADAGERDPVAMLRRLELPIEAMAPAVDLAHARGLHAIVSIFSTSLVDAAMRLPWDAFKVASPDIINLPLLDALMATGKPMIVSTGASTLDEVQRAAGWLEQAAERTMFLQCVSSYPVPEGFDALEGIGAVAKVTRAVCGYSDHTPGWETATPACEAGAAILEKHLTYDTAATGPDHAASLDAAGFAKYVRAARDTFQTGRWGTRLLPARKELLPAERDVRLVSRQSLVATHDLPEGHVLTPGDLTVKRPGTGLPPFMIGSVMGCTLARAVKADRVMLESDIAFCPPR